MSIRFTFRKERIITDEVFFMFKPFRTLWDWDDSEKKTKAHQLFYFIFLLCDLTEDNPLRDTHLDKKEEESKFYAFKDRNYAFTKAELKVLQPAIDCFIKYNTIAEERILEAFDIKANELRQALEDTMPEAEENNNDGVISFVSNSAIITKGLKNLDKVKKSKINVISAVRREAMTQRVRGQMLLSPLSKGSIALPSFVDREE
jgi:hypothetical protein